MSQADMLVSHGKGLLELARTLPLPAKDRAALVARVGRKGAGLSIIPAAWTPPFFFIDAAVFDEWLLTPEDSREQMLLERATVAVELARRWDATWKRGVVVRSSATDETLRERGANATIELAADYDPAMIARAIAQIYTEFFASAGSGSMALTVQARVANLMMGHISNEQRVSKTANHWMWEQEPADTGSGRFNSQREKQLNTDVELLITASKQNSLIARVRTH